MLRTSHQITVCTSMLHHTMRKYAVASQLWYHIETIHTYHNIFAHGVMRCPQKMNGITQHTSSKETKTTKRDLHTQQETKNARDQKRKNSMSSPTYQHTLRYILIHFYRSFPAKEPYNSWLFCEKRPALRYILHKNERKHYVHLIKQALNHESRSTHTHREPCLCNIPVHIVMHRARR